MRDFRVGNLESYTLDGSALSAHQNRYQFLTALRGLADTVESLRSTDLSARQRTAEHLGRRPLKQSCMLGRRSSGTTSAHGRLEAYGELCRYNNLGQGYAS